MREETNKYLGYMNCLDSTNICPKITRDRLKAIPDIKEDIKDILDIQTIKGDIKDAKMIYHQIEFHFPFCVSISISRINAYLCIDIKKSINYRSRESEKNDLSFT